MKNTALVAALAIALFASDSGAQTTGWSPTGEIGIAHAGEITGSEVGVGARYAVSDIRLTGIVGGFIYPNSDDRYRSETFNNGNTICRDTSNGQFADESRCAADVSAYGKLELSYAFTDRFEGGLGGRFGEDGSSPYGTLAYRWPSGWAVYGAAGSEYASAGISYRR
ncbi:MAG: hypothetical protein ACJA0K_001339 [Maricaulis maris]|jgi:hypothetical protein